MYEYKHKRHIHLMSRIIEALGLNNGGGYFGESVSQCCYACFVNEYYISGGMKNSYPSMEGANNDLR